MTAVLNPTPDPPDWRVAWDDLEAAYPVLRTLTGCPQDPIHHAEGDVRIHTRMVCEELASLPAWRALDAAERSVVFAAAVLHDVGKPDCTKVEPDGRVTSRGHSRRGSILARQLLWRLGVPFVAREQVASLIRHHQAPYWLLDREDPFRVALEVSQTARCDLLALLAEADVRGRVCADQARLLDNVALFAEFCREHHCLTAPYAFPSDHSRFLYFFRRDRYPTAAHEAFRCEVVLLSGLPGAGKDHWARTSLADWPVVSLDAARAELDVDPADRQGEVLNLAREQAREHLRAGRSFVWNATNLSRQVRGECIRLFAAYDARIRIAYVEVPPEVQETQNRQRTASVPAKVIARMLDRWEVPDLTEAHAVEYHVRQ